MIRIIYAYLDAAEHSPVPCLVPCLAHKDIAAAAR